MNYIQLLRGAPMTVLMAILSEGGQTTTGKLVRITGYSQPTVTRACRQLCEAGLATTDIFGWQLIGGGLQMILGTSGGSKNILPTTTVNNIVNFKESSLMLEAEGKNILLLKSAGVGEPMRSELAKLDPAFVVAHVNQWRKERKPVPLLIHRLRNGDLAPKDPDDNSRYYDNQYSDSLE